MAATRRRRGGGGEGPPRGHPRGQDPISEMIRAHRAQRAIENLHNIPDRGTLDDYDRPSEGLGRKKLAYRVLTEEEQDTNSTDSRVLASHTSNDALRAIGPDHQKTDSTDGRILAPAALAKQHFKGGLGNDAARLPDGVRVNLGSDVDGTLDGGNLPNVPKGKLPGDVQYGRPRSGNIDWADKSVPKRAIDAVDWGQVDNKPPIVTPGETKKFLTKKEAEKLFEPRKKN